MSELLGEKCAVAAAITNEEGASELVAEILFALQHRGPEASGTASMLPEGWLAYHRATGLVRDVYDEETMAELRGKLAIGHDRYSTNGKKNEHLQPVVDDSLAFALAHNGNLPVTSGLEKYLQRHNIVTSRLNDSEMMSRTVAQRIRSGMDLPAAIQESYDQFQGAFSCVAMHDNMIVAFRDAKGIRPLAFGSFADGYGYAIASETCGLDIIGAEYEREIRPGEMLIITDDGYFESVQLAEPEYKLDIFEMVYFARHDSILYGERVNEIRRRLGEALAIEHPELMSRLSDPLVVPIPDTSVPASEGYAESLGLPHRSAIIKNRYIGRTFLSPSHHQRHSQLKRKHSVIPEALVGRDVILMDDSIVRGNTMPRLVQQVRALGARSVSVLIASPPVRFPDFYGIDTPEQSELMAFSLTPEEMRKEINADYLGFLSLSGLINATNRSYDEFNLSCFNGKYTIDIGDNMRKINPPVSMEYIDVY